MHRAEDVRRVEHARLRVGGVGDHLRRETEARDAGARDAAAARSRPS